MDLLSDHRAASQGFLTFVAIWLGVTTALSVLSGWWRLRRHYPAPREVSLLTLSGQSGWVGFVQYSGCLTLAACPSGLKVRSWWILGPLDRPFTVPWTEIDARSGYGLFGNQTRLMFERGGAALKVSSSAWESLLAAKRRPPT